MKLIRKILIILNFIKSKDYKIASKKFPLFRGRELPWFTTSAIKQLESMNLKGKRIFEFGGGYSSIYFHKNGCSLEIFERDDHWRDWIKNKIGDFPSYNATEQIKVKELANKFDIVVVDVFNRPDNFEIAEQLINSDGIIILDDSQWYPKFICSLKDRYHQSHYWGYSSGRWTHKCTSFFIKKNGFSYDINPFGEKYKISDNDREYRSSIV